MAAPQGSAPPVEASPSMELRAYLVRSDGKGGAVELGRLQHYANPLRPREAKASLESPARDRSPAPDLSSDGEAAAEKSPARDRCPSPDLSSDGEAAAEKSPARDRSPSPDLSSDGEAAAEKSPARDRSPSPDLSSDGEAAAEFGGKEAAKLYLVVLMGGEAKKVARLSSFVEEGYCTEKADEANVQSKTSSKENTDGETKEEEDDGKETTGTGSDVSKKKEEKALSQAEEDDEKKNTADTYSNTFSHEDNEEDEEEDKARVGMDSQKEEEKNSSHDESESADRNLNNSSHEEEDEYDADAGTDIDTLSQEKWTSVEEKTASSLEEQTSSSQEADGGTQYSVTIRLWPESARVVLVLFDWGRWRLTRGYNVSWLNPDEMQMLEVLRLGPEVTQTEFPVPKGSYIWPENCTSFIDFKGSLEYSDHLEEIISLEFTPSMHDFCVNGELGDGGSGTVYECSYMNSSITKSQYAIKIMDIDDECDCMDTIEFKEPREVNIMSSLKDEHIVCFYQAWSANGTFKSGQTSHKQERSMYEEFSCGNYLSEARYVAIQMERCFRSLKHDMPSGPREINIDASWMVFEKVTKAVQSMHHKGTPNRGTLLYMAPELDEGPLTQKVDIYSLGVIFLELFHPFATMQEQDRFLKDLRNDIYPIDCKVDKAFLKKLLALRPSDRPSTDEILEYIANRQQDIYAGN